MYEDTKTVQEPKDLKLPKPKIQVDIKKVGESAFEISILSRQFMLKLCTWTCAVWSVNLMITFLT